MPLVGNLGTDGEADDFVAIRVIQLPLNGGRGLKRQNLVNCIRFTYEIKSYGGVALKHLHVERVGVGLAGLEAAAHLGARLFLDDVVTGRGVVDAAERNLEQGDLGHGTSGHLIGRGTCKNSLFMNSILEFRLNRPSWGVGEIAC